jgi:MFS family permease
MSVPPVTIVSMSLTPYRRVLALPGVRTLTLLGVLARIPHTAISMVLTLHVVLALHRGYGDAGLVVGAFTVGAAVGAPWRGRAVDRFGLRRALVPSLVVEAAVWGAAPWLPFHVLVGAVVLAGLLGLPVFTVIRLSMSVLVPVPQRRTAYALDSMAVEGSFMVGPALGVLVATHLSTTFAMLLLGAATVAAGVALMIVDPPTRSAVGTTVSGSTVSSATVADLAGETTAGKRPRVPVSAPLIAVLGAAAAATLVLAGTDVAIVAQLRSHDALDLTGLVMVAWCGSSLLGGLVYGAAPRGVPPLALLLALAALTVPIGLAGTPLVLCLAVLPAGALCAPLISSTAEAVARLVPERVRGEAMGWHGSALTAGSAAGAPVAGFAIDSVAPWAGFGVVGALGAVLAVIGLTLVAARRRRSLVAAVSTPDGLEPEPTPEAGQSAEPVRQSAAAADHGVAAMGQGAGAGAATADQGAATLGQGAGAMDQSGRAARQRTEPVSLSPGP